MNLRKRNVYWLISLVLLSFIITGCMQNLETNDDPVSFHHIHGLDYTNDGKEIYVPAHHGLKVYRDGEWYDQTEGEPHDYMGFSMYEGGFYSSGHPAPGSKLGNPLGIVKSVDQGKSLEILDLYEEVDFHGMAVGYRNEMIYVFNPEKNSRMEEPGLYYSPDGTKTWEQSRLAGLYGQPTSLAAHPTENGVLAIGTGNGVFVSRDFGNTFEPLLEGLPITALSFDFNHSLLVGLTDKLVSLHMNDKEETDLNIPPLQSGDAIIYVRQNPNNADEYVLATYNRDIMISKNNGKTWETIAADGIAK